MSAEPPATRALAWTATGCVVVLTGAAATWWAWPGQPALAAVPVAAGAGLFLLGVRRFVKPPRTGAEE